MRTAILSGSLAAFALASTACGGSAIVSSNLPLQRVVVYRNGVAYFERGGLVEEPEVRFKMKEGEVGDFLATLAVMERGGSSVRAAAFPLKDDQADDAGDDDDSGGDDDKTNKHPKKKKRERTEDEKKGLKVVVLSLDGRQHDLLVGYVAESPVWRPSYRLVVQPSGEADLQAWGIVQNLSGEDWKDVQLTLVAGAPLAFEATLGTPVIPTRPTVTDSGEVIAAVPRAETSLEQTKEAPPPPPPPPAAAPVTVTSSITAVPDEETEKNEGGNKKSDKPGKKGGAKDNRGPSGRRYAAATGAAGPGGGGGGLPAPATPSAGEYGYGQAAADVPAQRIVPSPPRNLRSLAAIAQEGGTTRYAIPLRVTIPDHSASMVMLLSQRVPGEAIFLFAPDGGVADSSSHPFRVARFSNKTSGALEKGPIAVFEQGSFLGQGMVDPLPMGATATVPFALERAIAIDQERKYDEQGERVAKIENSELTIERDAVTKTKYRIRNGGDALAKVLVKHPRISDARLYQPPKDTEDNVGTGSALVPTSVGARQTGELVVDERQTLRRTVDWFSDIADNAVKAYMADARSDKAVVAALRAAWDVRAQIVTLTDTHVKLAREQSNLENQTSETRANLRVLEKNATAAALRDKLTKRLGEMAARLDEITKQLVDNDSKLAELRVRFREEIREIKIAEAPPAKP